MKIILADNFDRDNVSDELIAENVSVSNGEHIVNLLNDCEGPESPRFYKLVNDDYKLYVFEP